MTVRCPVCRADNAAGPACRRCRADLGLLFDLEGRRAELLGESFRAAEAGDLAGARRAAAEAEAIRAGDDARGLRAAVELLAGDFAEAWRLYPRAAPHA